MSDNRERIMSYNDLVAYRRALQEEDLENTKFLKRKYRQKRSELKSKFHDLIVPVSILLGGALLGRIFVSDSKEQEMSRANGQGKSSSSDSTSLENWLKLAKVVGPLVTTFMATSSQDHDS
jgi:cytoskeletal protein RodZ